MPESPERLLPRLCESGYTTNTAKLTLTTAGGLAEADADRHVAAYFARLADEATTPDPLPQPLLGIRRREHAYEQLQAKLRGDDCPASAFSVGRQLLNDIDNAWLKIDALREKKGRDRCVPAEQAAAQAAEAQRQDAKNWEHLGL